MAAPILLAPVANPFAVARTPVGEKLGGVDRLQALTRVHSDAEDTEQHEYEPHRWMRDDREPEQRQRGDREAPQQQLASAPVDEQRARQRAENVEDLDDHGAQIGRIAFGQPELLENRWLIGGD